MTSHDRIPASALDDAARETFAADVPSARLEIVTFVRADLMAPAPASQRPHP